MEDRKRPALSSADDIAPPSKRQAVNGSSKSREDAEMKDETWIEEYQKDAIFRQMLEYKREKGTLEARLEELVKKATDHDDHLRIVDAWWLQLLQEVELLVDGTASFQLGSEEQAFPSHIQFRDIEEFEAHLSDKGSSIKRLLDTLFLRLAASRGEVAPNISNLEQQVNTLLANQKDFLVKLDRLASDKDSLSDQLNTATLRYMKAERKLDRVKSTQVQKLEQQALANATARPPTNSNQKNGTDAEEDHGNLEALRLAMREANAVADKHREQLEEALAQNKTLQEELTSVQTRLTNLTDEDYSRTEVFKLFKNQHEELVKKVNSLESTNKNLESKISLLNEERESSRKKVETEAQALVAELEDQLQQSDTNLVRVRANRDELHADVTMLKQSKEQERSALDHMKELLSARDSQVAALESELSQLRRSEDVDMTAPSEVDDLTPEELREKYKKLQRDYEAVESELPGMMNAVKKYQALATKKVMDVHAQEERVALAIAEKSKADQKYFNARKEQDSKVNELKNLRAQNGKSSEIIFQLKDVEAHNRTLVSNLDKQLADLKQTNSSLMSENKKLESSSSDISRRYESLKHQIAELTNLAKSKDSTTAMSRERAAALEAEVERLKLRIDAAGKDRDKWKKKSLSNSSEEEEMLRSMATCSICKKDFKNTMIKHCGHIFCRGCVDDRIANRMRKCPNCNGAFDKSDIMTIHL